MFRLFSYNQYQNQTLHSASHIKNIEFVLQFAYLHRVLPSKFIFHSPKLNDVED